MHYHTKTECMVRTHHYLDWDLATESNRWSGGNKDHFTLCGAYGLLAFSSDGRDYESTWLADELYHFVTVKISVGCTHH